LGLTEKPEVIVALAAEDMTGSSRRFVESLSKAFGRVIVRVRLCDGNFVALTVGWLVDAGKRSYRESAACHF
jgi:hypothetical protein